MTFAAEKQTVTHDHAPDIDVSGASTIQVTIATVREAAKSTSNTIQRATEELSRAAAAALAQLHK